jgi:hypothetical protein
MYVLISLGLFEFVLSFVGGGVVSHGEKGFLLTRLTLVSIPAARAVSGIHTRCHFAVFRLWRANPETVIA